MAWRLLSTKPFSELMLRFGQSGTTFGELKSKPSLVFHKRVVYEMAAILFWPQRFNSLRSNDAIWVNIDWGDGLLPDGTKPLPELILTHQWILVVFTHRTFYRKCSRYTCYEFEKYEIYITATSLSGRCIISPAWVTSSIPDHCRHIVSWKAILRRCAVF